MYHVKKRRTSGSAPYAYGNSTTALLVDAYGNSSTALLVDAYDLRRMCHPILSGPPGSYFPLLYTYYSALALEF